jgi:hypothetical protein
MHSSKTEAVRDRRSVAPLTREGKTLEEIRCLSLPTAQVETRQSRDEFAGIGEAGNHHRSSHCSEPA